MALIKAAETDILILQNDRCYLQPSHRLPACAV